MQIKMLCLIIAMVMMCKCLTAQQSDTTTIVIYDSTTHTYKRVNLEQYNQHRLAGKIITGQVEKDAKEVKDVTTTKMFKISRKGEYRYNYGGILKPVTPLTFYFKIKQDSLIPQDIDAQKWLGLSVRQQMKVLRKHHK